MTSIAKPPVRHPSLQANALGLTRRDYEGAMSTLCAGCGHDSVTAALVQAFWELDVVPHRAAKLSGIGCSSKTTAYFLKQAHGFNSVHGRMPSIASGANAANRALTYVGISGDGDSLSIGLGQLCHVIRRNVTGRHQRTASASQVERRRRYDARSSPLRRDPALDLGAERRECDRAVLEDLVVELARPEPRA